MSWLFRLDCVWTSIPRIVVTFIKFSLLTLFKSLLVSQRMYKMLEYKTVFIRPL